MIQKDGTVVSHQNGIFRTNCIDCLDRTNVVQSLFSRVIAEEQLKVLLIKYRYFCSSLVDVTITVSIDPYNIMMSYRLCEGHLRRTV